MTYQEEERELRDRFAIAALTGLLAGRVEDDLPRAKTFNEMTARFASVSYDYADAMIAERDKR